MVRRLLVAAALLLAPLASLALPLASTMRNLCVQAASQLRPSAGRTQRLPVLDGSRAACEWGSDPRAVTPGVFPPQSLPQLGGGSP